MEVNDGNQTILCSKLVINPKKGTNIEEPTKGKVVTQAKYDEIMDKKVKEMNERFHDGNRKNDGNSFSIEIRG